MEIIQIRDRRFKHTVVTLAIDHDRHGAVLTDERHRPIQLAYGLEGWKRWNDIPRRVLPGRLLHLAPGISIEAIAFALSYLGVANDAAYDVACWSPVVRNANSQVQSGALPTIVQMMVQSSYEVFYSIDTDHYQRVSDRKVSRLRIQPMSSSLPSLHDVHTCFPEEEDAETATK